MGKTTKQTVNTQQAQITPINYFLNLVKQQGYSVKSYKGLAEQSVQLNGKIQIYFVPLKRNNGIKFCLKGVPNGYQINNLKDMGCELQVLNTYPNSYQTRLYVNQFNQQTKNLIDSIVSEFTVKPTK